jgi:dCTP deaminase
MIINSTALIELAPIKDMYRSKQKFNGVSHGLSEAGYDIRIKQDLTFHRLYDDMQVTMGANKRSSRFALASSIEEFHMPSNLVGVVHDKSTWARRGIGVFNTVIEPGWEGFLTLEIVYHGDETLFIPAGSGIAQVLFSEVSNRAQYSGKYQCQADEPVAAIDSI